MFFGGLREIIQVPEACFSAKETAVSDARKLDLSTTAQRNQYLQRVV